MKLMSLRRRCRQQRRMGRSKHRKKTPPRPNPQRLEVNPEAFARILAAIQGSVSEEDFQILQAALETLVFLTLELERKDATVGRLRRWLFGNTTERTDQVCPEAADAPESPAAESAEGETGPAPEKRPRRKGESHGRNGRRDFPGAARVKVPIENLKPGAPCPECPNGKVYPLLEPKVLIRVKGMAPIEATIFELERMRCNLCGEVFTAPEPAGVGKEKYDESAVAMVGLLKYDTGLPFNRLEKLQKALGIPLAATTQWELVEEAAGQLEPALAELIRQAAQGEVLHNDDTTMRILDLPPMLPLDAEEGDRGRTGVYTSGIIARAQGHDIALFFSGHQHAGENLADVLAHRAEDLPPPIHMCDALSHNQKGVHGTLLAHCLAHARRNFVDVEPAFPEEVRHVLMALRRVYHHDELAREQGLDPQERLSFHQEKSGQIMEDLEVWLRDQMDAKRVEPASGLGKAIGYMLKHWRPLTLFLRVPGAGLDNNIAERALKKVILHRKNALFYRTGHGAEVGDVFMSLTHTAALNRADPFAYLVALLRNVEAVADEPSAWMPWNFRERLSEQTKTA